MLAAAAATASPAAPDAQQQEQQQQQDAQQSMAGSSSSSSSSSAAAELPWQAWEGSDSFDQGSSLLEPHRDSVWEGDSISSQWASLLQDRQRLEDAWSTPAAAWSAVNTSAMDSSDDSGAAGSGSSAAAAAAASSSDSDGSDAPSELFDGQSSSDAQQGGVQQGGGRYPNGFSVTSSVGNRAVNPGVSSATGQVPLGIGALPPLNLPQPLRQQQQQLANTQPPDSSSSSSAGSAPDLPDSPGYRSGSSCKGFRPLVDPHPLEPSPLEPPSPALMHPELHEAAAQADHERRLRLHNEQRLLESTTQVRLSHVLDTWLASWAAVLSGVGCFA
jgi:hypothetical protein